MNLFLDTNIVIDYLGGKKPFFDDAERIVAAGYFGDAKLWAPAQSFVDAFYVLSRYADPEKVQDAIANLIEVVHPVSLTAEDLERACKLKWSDMEDCLVAVGSSKVDADYLVTRDAKGFERSQTPVISPADWLDFMKKEMRLTYERVTLEPAADETE